MFDWFLNTPLGLFFINLGLKENFSPLLPAIPGLVSNYTIFLSNAFFQLPLSVINFFMN